AANAYCAARLAHQAENHRQTESGALADFFRREERLEGAFYNLPAHSTPSVTQRYKDTILAAYVSRQPGVASGNVCCFDYQNATPRHGIARIESNVQQGRLDLTDVDQNRPELGRQHIANFNGCTDRAAQHLAHFCNDRVEVGWDR